MNFIFIKFIQNNISALKLINSCKIRSFQPVYIEQSSLLDFGTEVQRNPQKSVGQLQIFRKQYLKKIVCYDVKKQIIYSLLQFSSIFKKFLLKYPKNCFPFQGSLEQTNARDHMQSVQNQFRQIKLGVEEAQIIQKRNIVLGQVLYILLIIFQAYETMLSRTTQFPLTDRKSFTNDIEGQLGLIQFLKTKMEVVLQQVIAEKAQLQQRFRNEKQLLQHEIIQKNGCIQKLEQRARQLQGENQQIRYQFQQRMTLTNILKNQNGLLTKQYAREKKQMKLTIDSLIAENRQLKHALIENEYEQHKVKGYGSPSHRTASYKMVGQGFHSYKDLGHFERCKGQEWIDGSEQIQANSRPNKSINNNSHKDDSLSKSSIVDMLKKRRTQFKESRVTQIKGRNNNQLEFGLQKLETKTNLSRQRTAGGRFD